MIGTTISATVDGTSVASVTDSAIATIGFAGIKVGYGGAPITVSDTLGVHLDNFQASFEPNTIVVPRDFPRSVRGSSF